MDLISRENAVKELIELQKNILENPGMYDNDSEVLDLIDYIYNIIGEQPTIDAVPVVRAEWKYYKKQGIAVCTHCSFERFLDDSFGKAVACPNCGADMQNGDV